MIPQAIKHTRDPLLAHEHEQPAIPNTAGVCGHSNNNIHSFPLLKSVEWCLCFLFCFAFCFCFLLFAYCFCCSGSLGQARALFAYEAQDDTCLSFAAGDVITLVQADDGPWWIGALKCVQLTINKQTKTTKQSPTPNFIH